MNKYQEIELLEEAKSHMKELNRIADEFDKLNIPFSFAIYNTSVGHKSQTQTAIECLKDCKCYVIGLLAGNYDYTLGIITEYIDNKIKELEEEK